jgi:23S rRNA pseudouridine2605 synthase
MSTEIPEGDRIAKVLSRAGIASRRDAERMILDGRVKVNGKVVTSPALNVTAKDRMTVDDAPVAPPEPTRVWLYHKPAGVVTTTNDEQGRETVFEGLPEDMPRVMSVGRLDLTSEGLLILTNDGELKRRLELPSTGWLRRYRVRINGSVSELDLDKLRKGITVDGIDYQPMEVQFDRQQGANAWLTIAIREGKNREIRRVMEHLGVPVNRLIRVSYGPFQLGDLPAGEVKEIARKVVRDQLGGDVAPDEQTLTRRPRGAKPVKVRPIKTGPVMRTTKGGPRPGEASIKPSAARLKITGAGTEAAYGEKPRRAKPERAGHVIDKPGRNPDKAEAIAASREGGERPSRSSAAPRGGFEKKPYEKKPFAPKSAGFKSHGPRDADGPRGGYKDRAEGAAGRSAGYKSHRPAGAEAEGGPRKAPYKPRGPVTGARTPRPEGEGFAPRKSFAARGPKPEGGYQAREGGYKPREGGGDRPRGPKPEGGYKPREGGFKPRAEGEGYKPRGPKPEGGYQSRGPKPEGGYKPREGGYKPRAEGEGYKPRGPKPEGGYQSRGPKPEGGFKPREGGFKPRGEGAGDRPREAKPEGGYKPRTEGGYKPRTDGDAPRGPRPEQAAEGQAARKPRHKSGAAGFKPEGAGDSAARPPRKGPPRKE